MFSDFANSLTIRKDFFATTGVKREENVGKLNGLIVKYGGNVMRLSQAEENHFTEILAKKSIAFLKRD